MPAIAVGDLVIRKSHGGDILFKVTEITVNEAGLTRCFLKGLHFRLLADAPFDDLEQAEAEHLRRAAIEQENIHNASLKRAMSCRCQKNEIPLLTRTNNKTGGFFDLPGRVLHLDGDEDYLKMCLKSYQQLNMEAVGKWVAEDEQPLRLISLLKEYRPDILVITGHDSLMGSDKKVFRDINSYRNSKHFIKSVKTAREFQSSLDDLVIFAGACQSYFEAILDAGANFASSPNRVFIHAYDPVFIAEKIAFTPISRTVDINEAINASVTGVEGVGGVETCGKFRIGMPKSPY